MPSSAPPDDAAQRSILFVTGTDTGVGKTVVTAALIRRFRALDLLAAGVKPVETGCTYSEDHDMIAADGAVLLAECPWLPAMVVAPYRFAAPVAPAVAADATGTGLRIGDLADVVRAAHRYADLLVVEGAGGALSPMAEDGVVLDLARDLGAPTLIVARDGLGTQSQTLAVIEAARQRSVVIAGVLLCRHTEDLAIDAQKNRAMIERFGAVCVFQTMPFTAADPVEHAAAHLAEHAIDAALLERLPHRSSKQ